MMPLVIRRIIHPAKKKKEKEKKKNKAQTKTDQKLLPNGFK